MALVHHCISININVYTFLEAFTVTEINKIFWADSYIRRFKSTIVSEPDCNVMARIVSNVTSLMMDTYVSEIDSVSIIRVLMSYVRILMTLTESFPQTSCVLSQVIAAVNP